MINQESIAIDLLSQFLEILIGFLIDISILIKPYIAKSKLDFIKDLIRKFLINA